MACEGIIYTVILYTFCHGFDRMACEGILYTGILYTFCHGVDRMAFEARRRCVLAMGILSHAIVPYGQSRK